MKPKRYSPPSERPVTGVAERRLYRTGLPLLIALLLPPLGGYIWRVLAFGDSGWGVVGLIISAGFSWAVWHGLLARSTECNGRVYDRHERPVRYWLTIAIWFAFYALSVGALLSAPPPASGALR